MSLHIRLLPAAKIMDLVSDGVLPPSMPDGAVVFNLTCPHLERPAFSVFARPTLPQAVIEQIARDCGVAPDAVGQPTLPPIDDMRRRSVEQWSGNAACSCAERFWMRHGEQHHMSAEHFQRAYSAN